MTKFRLEKENKEKNGYRKETYIYIWWMYRRTKL